jgi:flagellar basal-body rod modification protein FlgD
MTVNPLLTGSSLAPLEPNVRVPNRTLNQNDFLKLLITQLTHQDPMKPQTDTEFVSQMTQFTNLEQTKTMQADIAKLRLQQSVGQGVGLLGQEVMVQMGDNPPVIGTVTGVEIKAGEPYIKIGEQAYSLDQVLSVWPAAMQGQGVTGL